MFTIIEEEEVTDSEQNDKAHETEMGDEGQDAVVEASAKTAVIIAHGSFNPLHRHHIEMMRSARKRLEDEGYIVTRAVMAITPSSALVKKCDWALSDEHRLHCIQLGSDSHADMKDWLQGDAEGAAFYSGSRYRAHVQEIKRRIYLISGRTRFYSVQSYWRRC